MLVSFGNTTAQNQYTKDDTIEALQGHPPIVWRIAWCESKFDPYAINQQGSGAAGVAQLLPGRGNGQDLFRSWGYDDMYNPWQAVAFIQEVVDRGMVGSQYAATAAGCKGNPY